MRTAGRLAGGAAALLVVATVLPHLTSSSPGADRLQGSYAAPDTAPVELVPVRRSPAAVRSQVAVAPLLRARSGGDGDSWRDTTGREYRLGLVNAPETNECYGAAATARRRALTAAGFRARVYTKDTYGRGVAVVTTAAGVNVNVYLARHGFANDRYLAQYRNENPVLARQLDVAFAAAKKERAGLWGACTRRTPVAPIAAPVPARPATNCHPDYATCIPVKGDGSGSGESNDLDCPDIRKLVQLKQIGIDPYRLDADSDGLGCDSYA
jgi:endonuclease YncB( thermonuclease family)